MALIQGWLIDILHIRWYQILVENQTIILYCRLVNETVCMGIMIQHRKLIHGTIGNDYHLKKHQILHQIDSDFVIISPYFPEIFTNQVDEHV